MLERGPRVPRVVEAEDDRRRAARARGRRPAGRRRSTTSVVAGSGSATASRQRSATMLELAVAVELVAEEVAEAERARAHAARPPRAARPRRPRRARARRPGQASRVEATPETRFAPDRVVRERVPRGARISAAIAAVVVLPFVAETSAEPCGSRAARRSIAPGSSFQSSLPGQRRAAAGAARAARAAPPRARRAISRASGTGARTARAVADRVTRSREHRRIAYPERGMARRMRRTYAPSRRHAQAPDGVCLAAFARDEEHDDRSARPAARALATPAARRGRDRDPDRPPSRGSAGRSAGPGAARACRAARSLYLVFVVVVTAVATSPFFAVLFHGERDGELDALRDPRHRRGRLAALPGAVAGRATRCYHTSIVFLCAAALLAAARAARPDRPARLPARVAEGAHAPGTSSSSTSATTRSTRSPRGRSATLVLQRERLSRAHDVRIAVAGLAACVTFVLVNHLLLCADAPSRPRPRRSARRALLGREPLDRPRARDARRRARDLLGHEPVADPDRARPAPRRAPLAQRAGARRPRRGSTRRRVSSTPATSPPRWPTRWRAPSASTGRCRC